MSLYDCGNGMCQRVEKARAEMLGVSFDDRPQDLRNPKDIAGEKKPPLALIPPAANVCISRVLEHGAEKYGPFNWRGKTIGHMAYISAARRHLDAIIDGENFDPDSAELHWGHVAATAAIVIDAISLDRLNDDRPKPGAGAKLVRTIDTTHVGDGTELD